MLAVFCGEEFYSKGLEQSSQLQGVGGAGLQQRPRQEGEPPSRFNTPGLTLCEPARQTWLTPNQC